MRSGNMIAGFRVWCGNKNEWEKDIRSMFVGSGGVLFVWHNRDQMRLVNMDNHILEWYSGKVDCDHVKVFEGDIITDNFGISGAVENSGGRFTFCNGRNIPNSASFKVTGNIHNEER